MIKQVRGRPHTVTQVEKASFATMANPVPPGAPAHIVIVIDENESYQNVIGSPNAPFVNSLAAQGTVFSNYFGISHPSQPNYLALYSGSTQGVTDDNTHSFPNTPSLGGELQQAGYSFSGYVESGNTASYHEPWLSFGDSQNDTVNFSQFPTGNFNQLPTVSYVIPNLNDDMTTDTGLSMAQTVSQGDQWLSANLSSYITWAKSNNSLFILTFDEDDDTGNNRVPMLVVGQGVAAGAVNSSSFNHYSLLATIENFYGLAPLGQSAGAATLGLLTTTPSQLSSSDTVVDWQNGSGGALASWSMNGAQITSSSAITYQGNLAAPDSSWSVAGLADFNGDGAPDFLWRNQNGTLVDWTMSGSQVISSQMLTFGGSPVSPSNSWNVAGLGDFNGDGKADILWRNVDGSLIDWTMNGSQVAAAQQVTLGGGAVAPDSSWSVAGIGDFNGDGKADVLWRNADGTLIDWTMNGSQIASAQQLTFGGSVVSPDTSWSIAAIGDFNGDGKADLLWRNTSGMLVDWTMNGSQITNVQQVTSGGSAVSLDSSWQIAQIGDFNGNGTSGILWRNTNGNLEEWSMNGAQITSASPVTFQGNAATPPNSWTTLLKPTDF
ncbi:MAG: VCBS repeat-containing protein [Hyphomicrobiales bacterium]|nr:VCBS repeat-containing protein [Hyphomicrobiales bacterium]